MGEILVNRNDGRIHEKEEIPRCHDVMKRDTPFNGKEGKVQRIDLLARSGSISQ